MTNPVKKINKKAIVSELQFVEFQILSYFFIKHPSIKLSSSELSCLAELALLETIDSVKFYEEMVDKEIFKNPQSTRNFVNKIVKTTDGVIAKTSRTLRLSIPDIEIQKPAVFTFSIGVL